MALNLSHLKPTKGSKSTAHRVGRGESSGWGKTAGRGHKGQKARSSAGIPVGFEGGQMPLHRRSPKWGFNQLFRTRYQEVNLQLLEKNFSAGDEVTPAVLFQKKVIRSESLPVKILATGEITKSLKVTAHAFSKVAQEKIEKSGGSHTIVEKK